MAKITKIKAQDPATPTKNQEEKPQKPVEKKSDKPKEKSKKPFILFRPFIALGHYLRDSWREIRQVRWPSRKATWKMLFAVLVYSAIFIVVITLLDILLKYLFNLIIA